MVQNPISISKALNGQNRCHITTWGLPTAVNTPKMPTDAQGNESPVSPAYAAIAAGDTFTAERCPHVSDKTVHITGTANGQGITLQGSNDGTNWVTLTNVVTGAALTNLQPGTISQIAEETLFVQPALVGAVGGGTTAMSVIMVGRAQF